ncbi:nucleoside recognition domain-containing protein [Aminipila sp.]|uniref:nucleoside recognition domain-containing protein n=1 Tax=Aminipila sp. TaxID=2060095 RepID=UPI001DE97581|nr:nucleoside recognition domain-containing protein [Aminipila sp.]MBE6033640.1 nucleoside recognition protein [Clostridiales bacterium]
MMNYIWAGLVAIAVIAGIVTGNISDVQEALFSFANTAVEIVIGLIGVMVFFTGLMSVMKEAGLCEKLGKLLGPVMTKLFPEVPADHPAMSSMALYFAANILGIGNAATPFGLKAMADLQTLNKTKHIATDAQCMLLAIATTSITLIPVTVLALRSAVQVQGAAEIVGPVILATTISTVTGVAATILLGKLKRYKLENVIAKERAAGTLEINENYIGNDPIEL